MIREKLKSRLELIQYSNSLGSYFGEPYLPNLVLRSDRLIYSPNKLYDSDKVIAAVLIVDPSCEYGSSMYLSDEFTDKPTNKRILATSLFSSATEVIPKIPIGFLEMLSKSYPRAPRLVDVAILNGKLYLKGISNSYISVFKHEPSWEEAFEEVNEIGYDGLSGFKSVLSKTFEPPKG